MIRERIREEPIRENEKQESILKENEERLKEHEKIEQVKVSFYINKEQSLAFDQLSLNLKRKGIKKSKSELIREEIDLILEKYKNI